MDRSEYDGLACTAFPKQHWPQISSTNPLERLNRQIKRRADVVGIFPNDDSIIRHVGALMLEQTDEWAVQRRSMTLETLVPISDDPFVSLPGVTGQSLTPQLRQRTKLHHELGRGLYPCWWFGRSLEFDFVSALSFLSSPLGSAHIRLAVKALGTKPQTVRQSLTHKSNAKNCVEVG
jgi:hypothetical protein